MRGGNIKNDLKPNAFGNHSRHRSATLCLHASKMCTDLDFTLLYILTDNKSTVKIRCKSTGKIRCQRSFIVSCRHARALSAGLTPEDHVLITTDKSVCLRKKEFDEI